MHVHVFSMPVFLPIRIPSFQTGPYNRALELNILLEILDMVVSRNVTHQKETKGYLDLSSVKNAQP